MTKMPSYVDAASTNLPSGAATYTRARRRVARTDRSHIRAAAYTEFADASSPSSAMTRLTSAMVTGWPDRCACSNTRTATRSVRWENFGTTPSLRLRYGGPALVPAARRPRAGQFALNPYRNP
jgi:hypothetical protein